MVGRGRHAGAAPPLTGAFSIPAGITAKTDSAGETVQASSGVGFLCARIEEEAVRRPQGAGFSEM